MSEKTATLQLCAYVLMVNTQRTHSRPSFHGTLDTVETQIGTYSCTYTAVQDQNEPCYHMQEISKFQLNTGQVIVKKHDAKLIPFSEHAIFEELQNMIAMFRDDLQQTWFIPKC